MPITVNTAAVATNLLVVENLPDAVRGDSQENDARLDMLIRRVSAAIPRHIGHILAEQTYQEDVPGYGDTILQIMETATTSEGWGADYLDNVCPVAGH